MAKLILFSHGMGVMKDNRGLFPYLKRRIEPLGFETKMFDYNDINTETKEVYVKPFSKQAVILQDQIDRAKEEGYEEIVIIGQSQGSLIPALCDVSGVKQVIGISPFFHTNIDDILRRYSAKEGNVINFAGETRRRRSDGTTTVMPKEYWEERFKTNVEDLYNSLAKATQLTLINALQDEIMQFTNLQRVKYARIINTDGDHDFSDEFLPILVVIIVRELKN